MRIDPEEEMLLTMMVETRTFSVNWTWPLFTFFGVVSDFYYVLFEEWTWWSVLARAFTIYVFFAWWGGDIAKLEADKAKLADAHQ